MNARDVDAYMKGFVSGMVWALVSAGMGEGEAMDRAVRCGDAMLAEPITMLNVEAAIGGES